MGSQIGHPLEARAATRLKILAWAAPVQKGHQHGLHDTAVPISLVYQFQELKNNVMAVLSDNPQFGDPQPDLSS
jgi:hypothetical protein